MNSTKNNKTLNTFILTLYLLLIFFTYLFVLVTDNVLILAIVTPLAAVGLWFFSRWLLKLVYRIPSVTLSSGETFGKRKLITAFVFSAIAAFAVMMLWFIAFRPGSFQGDCLFQYKQSVTGQYTDWHPAWQTFLFYTIPLRLTGGAVWSMTFFQMVWFSLTIGYMFTVIYRYAGFGWATGIWLYIVLNPYTGQMMLYPWKDSAFAIAGGIAMVMAACIVFTQGSWADNPWRCILLGFFAANCTLFRHNAIIFTAVLILAMFFYVKRKSFFIILGSFILTYIIIQGPVSAMLHVESDPQSVVQAVGLPMTIIGNVTKETPERLDAETAEFVYSMADQEAWESDYELGNFGVMKYYGNIDMTLIEETGVPDIVRMSLKCVVRSPKASIRAILALTDIVYGIDQKDEGHIGTQIEENEYGIMYQGNERLAKVLETYYKLVRLHGYNFFRQFAFAILAVLVFVLGRCDLSKLSDWRRILPVLCIFTYSFGTMLLLTSADSRFFYIDYLVCPPAIVMLLASSDPREETWETS